MPNSELALSRFYSRVGLFVLVCSGLISADIFVPQVWAALHQTNQNSSDTQPTQYSLDSFSDFLLQHPTAILQLNESTLLPDTKCGDNNVEVEASLDMKGSLDYQMIQYVTGEYRTEYINSHLPPPPPHSDPTGDQDAINAELHQEFNQSSSADTKDAFIKMDCQNWVEVTDPTQREILMRIVLAQEPAFGSTTPDTMKLSHHFFHSKDRSSKLTEEIYTIQLIFSTTDEYVNVAHIVNVEPEADNKNLVPVSGERSFHLVDLIYQELIQK